MLKAVGAIALRGPFLADRLFLLILLSTVTWFQPWRHSQFFLRIRRAPGASTVMTKFERMPVPNRPASPGKNSLS